MEDLSDTIIAAQAEFNLLRDYLGGKYPEAYLTTVAMDDEPLLLFPGDRVMTKYGDRLTIKGFDRENKLILFRSKKVVSLPDHRISSIVRRKNAPST
jgi:hypothetical protein